MSANVISGKQLSEQILTELKHEVANLKNTPGLAIILVGDDPSSHLYVKLKKRAAEYCNINFNNYLFSANCDEREILEAIEYLNHDPEVDGIIVQLPLPEKFNTDKIIAAIDPNKDIDGFHPQTVAKINQCDVSVVSPLVGGIVELVKAAEHPLINKKITILCNHKIFASPFKCFWGDKNDISVVTTEDADYKIKVKEADVLIASVGLPHFITSNMVKPGAIVIDVGINKIPQSNDVLGDVEFDGVSKIASHITPVPGGVGPVTVAMLLKNTVNLHKKFRA